jgi:hypothetical protein
VKYWSEVDGCYIEGESIWDGRGAIPGVGFVERRSSYLVQSANRGADTTHEFVMVRRGYAKCACGWVMRLRAGSPVTQCKRCRGARGGRPRNDDTPRLECGCGRLVTQAAQRAGLARCQPCRRAGERVGRVARQQGIVRSASGEVS